MPNVALLVRTCHPQVPCAHRGCCALHWDGVALTLPFNSPASDTARRALPPPRQEDAEPDKSWLLHVLGDPQHPYQASINHGKPTRQTSLVSILEMTSLLRGKAEM